MEFLFSDAEDVVSGSGPEVCGTTPAKDPILSWSEARKLVPTMAKMMVDYKGEYADRVHEKFAEAAKAEDAETMLSIYAWLKAQTKGAN